MSWDDFERERNILDDSLKRIRSDAGPIPYISRWLYRGQSDKDWFLETTLERFVREEGISSKYLRIDRYLRKINSILPAIRSLSMAGFVEILFEEVDDIKILNLFEAHALLYHLRHLGFPSPLLDWSESYLVAAFFAFQRARPNKDVAIYAMNLELTKYRVRERGVPHIIDYGSYVETHRRHFNQQSRYSLCYAVQDKEYCIFPHENAVMLNPEFNTIQKYIIASSERKTVLEKLHHSNINAYTLFGSDEALMDTLAYREFVREMP
ncbi:FRG domain-containing protein [Microvirga tunisiensis]|uniref:FRG domain-containing protein n=1 Tax=Pannonibacter tanglangensis TaxID=2750084 RepID=A0A7X5F3J6_9HYPH|nr:FRG domain-containing protein [Pannonibacter sp. XCT-53]